MTVPLGVLAKIHLGCAYTYPIVHSGRDAPQALVIDPAGSMHLQQAETQHLHPAIKRPCENQSTSEDCCKYLTAALMILSPTAALTDIQQQLKVQASQLADCRLPFAAFLQR